MLTPKFSRNWGISRPPRRRSLSELSLSGKSHQNRENYHEKSGNKSFERKHAEILFCFRRLSRSPKFISHLPFPGIMAYFRFQIVFGHDHVQTAYLS